MKRALFAMMLFLGSVAGFFAWQNLHAGASAAVPQGGAAQRPTSFGAVDVFVDSGRLALGSYQIELTPRDGAGKLVGLEGGESPAFRNAPYYDPALLKGAAGEPGRSAKIVVAAFSIDENLPTGLTRVARLHLVDAGNNLDNQWTTRVVVVTDSQGKTNEAAKVQLRPFSGETR